MALAPIARVGDPSDHGGTILGPCSTTNRLDGLGVARTGDLHTCPIRGHGVTALTGTGAYLADGLRAVRVGDVAGCGATITAGSGSGEA
jgi:uncharacterized Zn-binding protein involved in type VI secretion